MLGFGLFELHLLAATPLKDENDGAEDNHLSADSKEGPKGGIFIWNETDKTSVKTHIRRRFLRLHTNDADEDGAVG